MSTIAAPFGAYARRYRDAGWAGVLPLPAGAKTPPPGGYTGSDGADPSEPMIEAWSRARASGNIALRMPETVIGLDVDAYGGKGGHETLTGAVERFGPLPDTYRATSRADGRSGIRFYRVPAGLAWPGELSDGGGVEIIQRAHRYAVAPPSIHPSGGVYRWIGPDGSDTDDVPAVEALPDLPTSWVEGITGGLAATLTARIETSASAALEWLQARERASSAPCKRMRAVLPAMAQALVIGSAHSAGRTATLSIMRLSDDGHAGALDALERAWLAFRDEVCSPARQERGAMMRDEWEAQAEWAGLVASAAGVVHAAPRDMPVCDCDMRAFAEWFCGPGAPPPRLIGQDERPALDGPDEPAADPLTLDTGASAERAPNLGESWAPIDLTDILAGKRTSPDPTFLRRSDGAACWYPGRINGLIGPSESGKSWVAFHALAQAVEADKRVTVLDFEDSADGYADRMHTLGLDNVRVLDYSRYISPAEGFSAQAQVYLSRHIREWRPDLVILDGFNAAMSLMNLDLNSNYEVTQFFQRLLQPIAATGACVVYIDHVAKNRAEGSRGGIGAQAKRAMTTGCTLSVELRQEFARGQSGKIDLYVDKDRTGYVRGASLPTKGAHWAGSMLMDSIGGNLDILLQAPNGAPPEPTSEPTSEPEGVDIREAITDYLEAHGMDWRSAIQREIPATSHAVGRELDVMADEGILTVRRVLNGRKYALTSDDTEGHEPLPNRDRPTLDREERDHYNDLMPLNVNNVPAQPNSPGELSLQTTASALTGPKGPGKQADAASTVNNPTNDPNGNTGNAVNDSATGITIHTSATPRAGESENDAEIAALVAVLTQLAATPTAPALGYGRISDSGSERPSPAAGGATGVTHEDGTRPRICASCGIESPRVLFGGQCAFCRGRVDGQPWQTSAGPA